jgi:hypothetical protein
MLMKGKWIRIECDYTEPDHYHPSATLDIANQYNTHAEMIKQAKNEGWEKKDDKWYCPRCIECGNHKKNI